MARTHRSPIQVRFADSDAMGHINNAAYATYGETARLGFLESLSPTSAAMARRGADPSATADGLGVILARLEIDFRRQVTLGQTVHVDTSVAAIGRKSFTLRQIVVADGRPAAEMRAVVVTFDVHAQATREIPAGLRAELAAYWQDEPRATDAAPPAGRGG